MQGSDERPRFHLPPARRCALFAYPLWSETMPSNQLLVNRYVDVFEFSNGVIEILANGVSLAYREHDRLHEVDTGALEWKTSGSGKPF
jgi:hypothetical protein